MSAYISAVLNLELCFMVISSRKETLAGRNFGNLQIFLQITFAIAPKQVFHQK